MEDINPGEEEVFVFGELGLGIGGKGFAGGKVFSTASLNEFAGFSHIPSISLGVNIAIAVSPETCNVTIITGFGGLGLSIAGGETVTRQTLSEVAPYTGPIIISPQILPH